MIKHALVFSQAQYKNHFVAASGVPPKLTTKSSSSSGWTSAGSLRYLPSDPTCPTLRRHPPQFPPCCRSLPSAQAPK